ncbi:MAG: prolyl oligopeptidase family protein [Prevotella sp.]
MRKTIITMSVAIMSLVSQAQTSYPTPQKVDVEDDYFGTKVPDPYRWMEDDTCQQVREWVEQENKVTRDYLDKIPFRKRLYNRLKELANYEKIGAPFKKNGKYYYYRNNGLQNQSVLYVSDNAEDDGRVFLDPNTLSADGTVALKSVSFSHNGKYMAYSISRNGSDWQEFYVMDVINGKLLSDHIEWAKFSGAAWHGDGFYYSAYDAPEEGKEFSSMNETHKIYYHKIGTPQKDDILFFQNPAFPKRFYGVEIDEKETVMYLTESGEGSGNNLFIRSLKTPDSQFIQMTSDSNYEYYPITEKGDSIIILTNFGAPMNRLMIADIRNPGIKDWKELVPERKELLSSADHIGDKLILTYMKDASDHAYSYTLDGKMEHEIKLPMVGSVYFTGKREDRECYYTFRSFTMPNTIYKYDMESGESILYKSPKLAFRTNDLVSEQVFYESKDGTRIPMTLTYRKGMKRNGKNPVFLYGYGGFAISLTPSFSAMRIPFIERGGIYAEANIRGGNEYGKEWHLAGTKMQKQNVFDDFISAAEWLIDNKYTNKDKIAINGASNGGLLVGACMTQRPDLFKVAIPEVGVMDMLRYHEFTIGWNWASDYGRSDDSKEMFEYLHGYSPLHNIKDGVAYPATLVLTADHDDRVVPAHSFKFGATLQEHQEGDTPVLIRIETNAGHGSGKPIQKILETECDIYSFVMKNLGMKY